ncbi:plasmid pRiA4b ORF-3 family protein [Pseudarthrobacter sp. P1]|uniref:plasmid pRiA4b ORF-3 family protein n=1 Tax=Pseudarthrobacter sp. P1 TaxID=3418418 RepID=UPI003CFA4FC8
MSRHSAAHHQGFWKDDYAGPHEVKTMSKLPLLADIWFALSAAGFIEVGATRVRLSDAAAAFMGGDPRETLLAQKCFVAEFLQTMVLPHEAVSSVEYARGAYQMAALLAATTAQPPIMDKIRAAMAEAENEDFGTCLVFTSALHAFERMAELGLLDIGALLVVPTVLAPCVAAAFAGANLPELWRVDRELNRRPPSSVYQLKIELEDAHPAVGRRILVSADMTLAELHHTIQLCFGWEDRHLHEFRVGGPGGTVYGPDDDEYEWDEPFLDEAAATIGSVLSGAGQGLAYTYDYGDCWDHRVTVQKVLGEYDGGMLPRCTAGSGAGPREDSGGTYGWSAKVRTANDPTAAGHREIRRWLGLGHGEVLDPTQFDKDLLNHRLDVFKQDRGLAWHLQD